MIVPTVVSKVSSNESAIRKDFKANELPRNDFCYLKKNLQGNNNLSLM